MTIFLHHNHHHRLVFVGAILTSTTDYYWEGGGDYLKVQGSPEASDQKHPKGTDAQDIFNSSRLKMDSCHLQHMILLDKTLQHPINYRQFIAFV